MNRKEIAGRRILVFGGTGSIGYATCLALKMAGAQPVKISRYSNSADAIPFKSADVTDSELLFKLRPLGDVDGVVYAVGNCPKGAADKEISQPLILVSKGMLFQDLERHVFGLINVFQAVKRSLVDAADIVIIGSAVTEIPNLRLRPNFLHCGPYAIAKSAQRTAVDWLRSEHPNFRFHLLSPEAVDTPFWTKCKNQPLQKVPVGRVVERVLSCFTAGSARNECITA